MTDLNISDRERTRRDRQHADSLAQRRAMTVAEWCAARRISKPMFYKLMRTGRAPVTYLVGTRRFISHEADAAWQIAREAETQESAA
jgi:predicted DNA-binding transcriptional regulator AlpA